jgi:hypothetical protein
MAEAQESKRSRRKVTKTTHFDFDSLENDEQRLVQQALRNSQRQVKRTVCAVPMAPTYYPSVEEFENPMEYINK